MKRGVTVISVMMCIQIWQLSSACDVGWSGQDCKLQCHCTNNKLCTNNGTCINGARCDGEWFGPACQYQNLVTVYTATWLLDGSRQAQTTVGPCNAAGAEQRIEVSWNISYPFMFLWVQFKQTTNYLTSNLNISITDENSRCDSIYRSAISQDTVEFRCRTLVNMTRLVYSGGNVRNVCSIYISGGRNIAVKQPAVQDSTYKGISAASNAVDGNRNSDLAYKSCMHTNQTSNGTPHYWAVNFSDESYSVNRYVLYSRWDFKSDPKPCCPERISGFTLTSWNNKGDQVFTYTAPAGKHALVHTVVSEPRDVARVNVTLDVDYLNFCEAEIYGVNICPENKYGLDCTKECNCVNNEQCHVDTGTCPSGCAPGYTFQGCQTECSAGTWGVDCRNSCSVNCLKKYSCNHKDGTCDGGCLTGFEPPLCTEGCTKGTWGINCIVRCNKNCIDEVCNSINGSCLNGCKEGYKGLQCSAECSAGTWGVDCQNSCSVNCSTKDSCNHKDGTCDGGCMAGFKPPLCTEVHETGANTNFGSYSKWVILAAGLIVIAGSIAVIVIINRKTKATTWFACTKSSKPKDSETIETSNDIQMPSFPTDDDGYLMSRERVNVLQANTSSDMSPQPATRGRQQEAPHRDVTATVSLTTTCGNSENPYDVIDEAQVSYFNYPELNQPATEESLDGVVENLPNTVRVTEHVYNTLEDVTYGNEQNPYSAPQFE